MKKNQFFRFFLKKKVLQIYLYYLFRIEDISSISQHYNQNLDKDEIFPTILEPSFWCRMTGAISFQRSVGHFYTPPHGT